jgi:hypothetical protein
MIEAKIDSNQENTEGNQDEMKRQLRSSGGQKRKEGA